MNPILFREHSILMEITIQHDYKLIFAVVGDTSTFWKKFAHIYHKPTLLLVQTFDSNCQQDYSYGFSDTSSFHTPFGFFSDYAEEKTDIKAVNSLRPTLCI